MKRRRGKVAALLLLPAAVGIAAAALWPVVMEELWLRQLGSRDQAVLAGAATRLGEMRSVRAIPGLVAILKERNYFSSMNNASFIPDIGVYAVEELSKRFDGHFEARWANDATTIACREALSRAMGPRAVPYLIDCLADPMTIVVSWSLAELARHGTKSPRALEAIAVLVEAKELHLAALRALGSFGAAGVPHLRAALRQPSAAMRFHAAASLAEIGPEARAALPELSRALSDREEAVRWRAALALERARRRPGVTAPRASEEW